MTPHSVGEMFLVWENKSNGGDYEDKIEAIEEFIKMIKNGRVKLSGLHEKSLEYSRRLQSRAESIGPMDLSILGTVLSDPSDCDVEIHTTDSKMHTNVTVQKCAKEIRREHNGTDISFNSF